MRKNFQKVILGLGLRQPSLGLPGDKLQGAAHTVVRGEARDSQCSGATLAPFTALQQRDCGQVI